MTRLGVLVAIGLMGLAVAAPAAAQKRDGGHELGAKQRDLRDTQKRLGEERAKAAEARKREAGLLAELETIERRLAEKRKQIKSLDGRIHRAQSDVAALQADIGRLQGRRTGQEEALGRRLRALYKLQADGGVLPLLFSRGDPVAQATQLRHMTTLATVDARLIREYRVTSEGLAERKSRLEAREYLERGAIRLYQPDAARIGGITEFRKAIAMAETHFIPIAPHNPNGIVCFAAHLHLATSASNFTIFEEGIGADGASCREAFGTWQDSPAYFWPLETPGIGLRGFTPAYVRDHAVDLATAERDTSGAP